MVEFLKMKLFWVREFLKRLNGMIEKEAHRFTLEQVKLVYDRIKELEVEEKELVLQLQVVETQALREALNPPDPMAGRKEGPTIN